MALWAKPTEVLLLHWWSLHWAVSASQPRRAGGSSLMVGKLLCRRLPLAAVVLPLARALLSAAAAAPLASFTPQRPHRQQTGGHAPPTTMLCSTANATWRPAIVQ